MIRALVWKEWHEHRSRFVSYWLTLNIPILILCVAIALSKSSRTPFGDLSNATVWKYLPLSLFESVLLSTVFMIAAGYLAVAIFSPENEDRSLFFLFEQPVPRKQYAAVKFLNGAFHVTAATWFAALLAPAVVYGIMLISGKVTLAGSSTAFAYVMAAAARGAIWGSLLALVGFTASALVSALMPRWWMAAASSVVLIVLFGEFCGGFFFDFFPADTAQPISVSANISAQWVTISRALTPGELQDFGHWRALPLLTSVLLTAAFCMATAMLYQRKEFK